MNKEKLDKIFREVEEMIKECIKKGLATEMILIEGLPNLKSKYGLDSKYYKSLIRDTEKV